MGTTLGTLLNLAIYIGLVAVGAVIGSRRAVRSRPMPWLGKLQFLALMILIVSLGVKLGANDEVISSLGQIGLAALLITVLAMAGSLLCLYLLRRFVFHLDRYGLPQGSAQEAEETEGSGGKADNSLTKWIVLAVALGMLGGLLRDPGPYGGLLRQGHRLRPVPAALSGRHGYGPAGHHAGRYQSRRSQGAAGSGGCGGGTLGCAALAGLFLPLGIKDAMAASAGFGWYSLAPTLLAPYSLSVSAVAFLSNVMREIFSIIAIPFVAKYLGYVECAALPGAAAMDTVLPVVVGATHERIAIYSFTSGVVLSLAVPLLVPAIVALPF